LHYADIQSFLHEHSNIINLFIQDLYITHSMYFNKKADLILILTMIKLLLRNKALLKKNST